jgi:hypothetical protein
MLCVSCEKDITNEAQHYPLGYGPVCSGCLKSATEALERELRKDGKKQKDDS